ncbi:hypothetical protein QBC39DRAFT_84910 [Podospora conica]|nr:hypothetical protein QBC39DRAFT_84910 [Schizothecium conicum]
MGQKLSIDPPRPHADYFCPETGQPLVHPLGTCEHCQAAHDIICQAVYVCPNTGYRLPDEAARKMARRHGIDAVECSACFQVHEPFSKRVYICPVTGGQITHPRETGGKCSKCSRSHEDNSTPMGSKEAVYARGLK